MAASPDQKFLDTFAVVLGALVAIAVVIYFISAAAARYITDANRASEVAIQEKILARIQPVGQVAIAGQDNSDLRTPGGMVASGAGPAAAAAPEPAATMAAVMTGQEVYESACGLCHTAGVAGSPVTGDAAAWAPRIAQGSDTLYNHAINGFQGNAGYMPAKGGRADLTDENVIAAVDYMVQQSQ